MPEVEEKHKENDEDKSEKRQKRPKGFPNKVVIRKLPPNLTAEAFTEAISPLPDLIEFYFVNADWTLGAEATSRAYIEFKTEEDVSYIDCVHQRHRWSFHSFRFSSLKISSMATSSLTFEVLNTLQL